MQALCGLQGIFDLFNCKTPVFQFAADAGKVNIFHSCTSNKICFIIVNFLYV